MQENVTACVQNTYVYAEETVGRFYRLEVNKLITIILLIIRPLWTCNPVYTDYQQKKLKMTAKTVKTVEDVVKFFINP